MVGLIHPCRAGDFDYSGYENWCSQQGGHYDTDSANNPVCRMGGGGGSSDHSYNYHDYDPSTLRRATFGQSLVLFPMQLFAAIVTTPLNAIDGNTYGIKRAWQGVGALFPPSRLMGNGSSNYTPAPQSAGPTSTTAVAPPQKDQSSAEVATLANNRGVDAANTGDWDAALKYLEEAHQDNPNDNTINHNLQDVRQHVAESDRIASVLANTQREVGHPSNAKANQASSGFGFVDANGQPLGGRQAGAAGTAFFGTPANPKGLQFMSASASTNVQNRTALQQLSSVQKDSLAAASAPDEAAKHLAGCGTAGQPCQQGDAIAVPKISGKTPAVAQLVAQIPPTAMTKPNAAQIKSDVEWYQAREADKTKAQADLVAVQKQIDDGRGDSQVLAAQKQTLTNKLADIAKDQKTAKDDIKKALVDDGLTWNAAAAPSVTPSNVAAPAHP